MLALIDMIKDVKPVRRALPLLGVTLPILLAACGAHGSSRSSGASRGQADVAYAGSLEYLNEKVIGPRFQNSARIGYRGRAAGSFGLAHEIAAGEISPNVFESIGSAPIRLLEPKFTTWYVSFASSPIVIAYNPGTRFGAELARLARHPNVPRLFGVLAQPGFLLGRTNPNTDPQGQAFYEMVKLGVARFHLATSLTGKIVGSLDNPAQVFSETSLESRLQSGQLDAASAFKSQAIQLHLPYITLPASMNFGTPSLARDYSQVSLILSNGRVVHGSPLVVDATVIGKNGTDAAESFISYQLSKAGTAAYEKAGYSVFSPKLYGTAVPAEIRKAVQHDPVA